MRFFTDFFSGMRTGLHPSNSSYPTRRGNKARAPQSKHKIHPVLDVLVRAGALALCVGLGALAFYAASRAPNVPHSLQPTPAWSATTPFPEEVLATDASVPPRDWRYIVLHHSASLRGSAEIFDQAHRQRGWRCLGYHFVIGNGIDQPDGGIAAGPRWYSQEAGAHANSAEYNEHGIGICLVGNFDEQAPSPAQLAAARALIQRLCDRYHIPSTEIYGHNQIRKGGSTACPGKFFPLKELKANIH